ncbi:MAG: hypothetical protein ACXWZG_06145 [Microbacterium sp.]
MAAEVMVRTYHGGNQAESAELYAEDAVKLAADGWVVASQTWVEGDWSAQAYWTATVLVIFVIGILLLLLFGIYKPKRTLMVTYERRVDAPESRG